MAHFLSPSWATGRASQPIQYTTGAERLETSGNFRAPLDHLNLPGLLDLFTNTNI